MTAAPLRPADCFCSWAAVNYALPIVVFGLLMAAFYASMGAKPSRDGGAALLLLLLAAVPLVSGGIALLAECDRRLQPRVVAGVIGEKLSSTGEDGSRTIGGRRGWRAGGRLPTVLTSNGFWIDDELARLMLTGSTNAWVVQYTYPCSGARGRCWQREFVSHALWSELRAGERVNVLTSSSDRTRGRVQNNPPLGTALVKLAIGATLVGVAAVTSGRWPRRRVRHFSVPAVVTSVERVGEDADVWRVGFMYFSGDGAAHEGADEVYVSGVRPGDSCSVIYPENDAERGILRRAEHQA